MKDDQDEHSLRLVEMIYRTALDPRDYDRFMARWDDWMNARIEGLEELQATDPAMSRPAVAAHFELAQRLIERMTDAPETTSGTGPRMLVDPSGRILWQNAEADRRIGRMTQKSVLDCQMTPAHKTNLMGFLGALAQNTGTPPIVTQIAPADDGRPIAFRAESMRRDGVETVALLTAMTPPWPRGMNKLLTDTHGLSEGECAICALLADGLSPTTIAARRGTSVATVRTQIKKIQSKTQTSSQTELATHLHAMQRLAETLPTPSRPALPAASAHGRITEEALGDRIVVVEEHGPGDGRPVVFLHGMLDGTGTTRRIRQTLKDLSLRLICPHRPSFGTSSPDPGAASEAPARLAQDIRNILDRRSIKNPVMVGHMAGSVYTPSAATACKARAIINVSGGVPILSNRQFDSMSRRQRLVAYTARYARSVLPFVINAGIRQIQSGGVEAFLDSLYEYAPVDNELVKDQEIRALIQDGYRFTVAQGNRAFSVDSELVVTDWTPLFDQSAPCPVHLVHGAHDPVVSVDSVREFARRNAGRVTLNVVEDAGQLVFYQTPEAVLDAAARAFDG